MKPLLFCALATLVATGAYAQRFADLETQIINPTQGSIVYTGQQVNISFRVKNNGNANLSTTDSLAVYLLIGADTVSQNTSQGTLPYRVFTSPTINSGDSATITYPIFFTSSFANTTLTFCLSAFPFNASNPITDTLATNNIGCTVFDVADPAPTAIGHVNEQESGMTIFPQPAYNDLYFKPANNKIQRITLVTSTGTVVKSIAGMPADHKIDISGLAPGLYFLNAMKDDGSSQVLRMVKY